MPLATRQRAACGVAHEVIDDMRFDSLNAFTLIKPYARGGARSAENPSYNNLGDPDRVGWVQCEFSIISLSWNLSMTSCIREHGHDSLMMRSGIS